VADPRPLAASLITDSGDAGFGTLKESIGLVGLLAVAVMVDHGKWNGDRVGK